MSYLTNQQSQIVTVDRPNPLTLVAKLNPILFAIDGIGYDVHIDNLTISVETDECDRYFVRASDGYIICENDRHAWREMDYLRFQFRNSHTRVGNVFSVEWACEGKGGNYKSVPLNAFRQPYNGPFQDIESLELFSQDVCLILEEG
jgi:hypothetical protein